MPEYQVVTCKTKKELPVACYGYGKVTADVAARRHVEHKRGPFERVYMLKGEAWIGVTFEEVGNVAARK